MGAVKEKLINDTEWLMEKLNQVAPDKHYDYDTCQDLITLWPENVFMMSNGQLSSIANDLWKIAQLSPEDGNKLMDISEDLYLFAMEEHGND